MWKMFYVLFILSDNDEVIQIFNKFVNEIQTKISILFTHHRVMCPSPEADEGLFF